jgi:hypothetical protein
MRIIGKYHSESVQQFRSEIFMPEVAEIAATVEKAVQIAVLQEQIKNLKEVAALNAAANEKLFKQQSDDFGKQMDVQSIAFSRKFDDQSNTMNALGVEMAKMNAALNRGKGAFTASILLASAIGGAVMAAIEWFRR